MVRRFCFRLARDLGILDVRSMMATTPFPLIRDWLVYYLAEQQDEEQAILQAQASAKLRG